MKKKVTKQGISKRLTYIREGIYEESIITFSKRMRYTKQHIHKMEHDGMISANMMMQLAELGISIDWLLTGIGEPTIKEIFKKNAKVIYKPYRQ